MLILAIGLMIPSAAAPLAAAAEDTVVTSLDFENGTWSPWTQSGGPSLSVVDVDGDKALRVGNRANDFDGIQSPTGLLTPGVEHTFTMQVKLEAPGQRRRPLRREAELHVGRQHDRQRQTPGRR